MSTSSVGVKQSWTSASEISRRGSVMPACRYASAAQVTTSGTEANDASSSRMEYPFPATTDSALTNIGVSVYLYASSARTTRAAAAPSATPEQSSTPSDPATSGDRETASAVTGVRNCAR